MKILAIDLSSVFRRNWEVCKHKDISEALTLSLRSIERFKQGFDRVVLCCDAGQSFRRLLWPASEANGTGYKGNRTDPGEVYRDQLRICKERLTADGCALFNAPEYAPAGMTLELGKRYFAEADDVIASLCAWARSLGHSVRIVTSDKDLLALVDDEAGIECASIEDGSIRTAADVFAKFGIAPEKIPLFLALAGDDSDGFKPYQSFGPTSATKLIVQLAPGPQQGIADIWAKPERLPELLGASRGKALIDAGPARGAQALRVATLIGNLPLDFEQILAEPVVKTLSGNGGPPPGKTVAEDMPAASSIFTADSSTSVAAPHQPAPPAQRELEVSRNADATGTAIVRASFDPYALEPRSQKGAWWLAEQAVNSRCFGLKYPSPSAAYMALLEGRALGMSAIASLKNAYVVKGNIGWSARCLRGLCIRHPTCEYFRIAETSAAAATAVWKRRGQPEETLRITLEEARRRGFIIPPGTNKYGKETDGNKWETDPKPMLVACVEREGARLGWPEVVAGLVTPEELEQADHTEYAEIVSAEAA